MQRARTGYPGRHAGFIATEVDDPDVPPSTNIPPPIEPYRSTAKFALDQIVTSNTIIPTCYFKILSIHYDIAEQIHVYAIKSLPYIGDHWQPDLTRTVFEDQLESMENIRRRNELDEMEGRVPTSMLFDSDNDDVMGELSDRTNNMNVSSKIEVGDEVALRVNSTGEKDKCEWMTGTVVGLNSQHGLWECFLVSVDKNSACTLPCTERLLKLVKKGTQSGRKKMQRNVVRVGGPGFGKTRTMRPVYMRKESGFQGPERFIPENGICFGDVGKLG